VSQPLLSGFDNPLSQSTIDYISQGSESVNTFEV